MPPAFSFRRKAAVSTSLFAAGLCLLLTGCVVVSKKRNNGKKHDNVSVATPFGGVHVQSNQTTASDLGLPVYPGAVQTTGNGKDVSANVDLGFGPWQLRVKVVKYRTSDPRDKVVAFYRKALGQFGTVIACDGNSPVGKPTVTDQGLTCYDNEHHGSLNININGKTSDSGFNLRAGSPHHQRIVAFEDTGGKGTRFSLVELTLPKSADKHATPD